MTTNQDEPTRRPNAPEADEFTVPPHFRPLIGRAPTLASEPEVNYWTLFGHVAAEKAPETLLDWIDVKDIADGTWEKQRLVRFRSSMIDRHRLRALCDFLVEASKRSRGVSVSHTDVAHRAQAYLNGDPEAIDTIHRDLDQLGLTEDAIDAVAFERALGTIERLDRLIHSATLRIERAENHLAARRSLRRAREDEEQESLTQPRARTRTRLGPRAAAAE